MKQGKLSKNFRQHMYGTCLPLATLQRFKLEFCSNALQHLEFTYFTIIKFSKKS